MVNAKLYYKNTAGEGPAANAARTIEFNTETKHFAPISLSYENNIKQTPNPTNDGTRVINVTENGLLDANYPISGFIKLSETTDVQKLLDFIKVLQINDALPFGRFGIEYPNAPLLGFEPSVTKGLSIGPVVLLHNAVDKSINFTYTMLFGGEF